MVRESALTIYNVGLNPTRTALLDFLAEMGAQIKILDVRASGWRGDGRSVGAGIGACGAGCWRKRELRR